MLFGQQVADHALDDAAVDEVRVAEGVEGADHVFVHGEQQVVIGEDFFAAGVDFAEVEVDGDEADVEPVVFEVALDDGDDGFGDGEETGGFGVVLQRVEECAEEVFFSAEAGVPVDVALRDDEDVDVVALERGLAGLGAVEHDLGHPLVVAPAVDLFDPLVDDLREVADHLVLLGLGCFDLACVSGAVLNSSTCCRYSIRSSFFLAISSVGFSKLSTLFGSRKVWMIAFISFSRCVLAISPGLRSPEIYYATPQIKKYSNNAVQPSNRRNRLAAGSSERRRRVGAAASQVELASRVGPGKISI